MNHRFFNAAFFAANRQRLSELLPGGLIVLTAAAQLQKSADEPFPFRQDSNFWYVTGIDEPDMALVIDSVSKEQYLILPDRQEHRNLWDGQLKLEFATHEASGLEVMPHKAGWQRLKANLQKADKVHTLLPPPEFISFYEFYANPGRRRFVQKIKRYYKRDDIMDCRQAFKKLRIIKQPQEIAAITAAVQRTKDTIEFVRSNLSLYTNERQIEAFLTEQFILHADGHGFDPIVAAGKNSTTIHYRDNRSPIKSGDIVLLDIGAQVDHYCADISRSLMPTQPSQRQVAIFEAVAKAQAFAISCIKPGVKHREYETRVEQAVGEALVELGVINDTSHDSVRRYFPTMTSHHLGLDVHDISDIDETFEAGMVITVEPGIYIPQEGIGVRIEDDVVITESGNFVI